MGHAYTKLIISVLKTDEETIRESVEGSIKRLGTIPDIYLIHNPFIPEPGKIGKFWTILEGLVEDGTLKGCSLGVSNFRPQDLDEVLKVCKIKPTVNREPQAHTDHADKLIEIEYHPYVMAHLDPVLKIQEEHNILVQAYGPLSPWLAFRDGPLSPVLERIAARLSRDTGKDCDPTAVLLLWVIGKGGIAVTSSANESRIDRIAALEDPSINLTKDEMDEIERVGRTVYARRSDVSRNALNH